MQKPLRCDQKWLEMKEAPGGRICAKCTKKIYDFRGMSWKEIEELQRQNNNSLCGMYREKQLENWGQEIPAQSPLNKAAIWGAVGLLGIGASSTEAKAQTKEVVLETTEIKQVFPSDSIAQKDSTEYIEVYGKVMLRSETDSTLVAAEGALVDVLHLTVGTITDTNGEFRLKVPKDSLYVNRKLRAMHLNFLPSYATIPAFINEDLEISIVSGVRSDIESVLSYSVAIPTTYQKTKWRLRNLFRRKDK